MEISIKCPNCNRQVPKDNDFCDFCGIKLNKSTAIETFSDSVRDSVFEDSMPPVSSKAMFCPTCRKPVTLALGFCPECGTPLVDKLTDTDIPSVASFDAPSFSPSTCHKCKITYDDPELVFCPECGLRLGEVPKPIPTPADVDSKPYGSVIHRESDYGSIPVGLRSLTEDDLRRK